MIQTHHPFLKKYMKRQYVFVVLALLIATAATGDNLIKEAKTAIKSGANLQQVEDKLMEAVKTEEDIEDLLDYYYYAALLNKKANDIENEKLYLKQGYDTVKFFSSIRSMYKHMFAYDSIAGNLTSYRKMRKRRNKAGSLLRTYHVNLLNGGKYYLLKRNYQSAYDFFDCFLTAEGRPFYPFSENLVSDSLRCKVARWATFCGYRLHDARKVLRYSERALCDSAVRRYIYEYQAKAYLALGDTANWVSSLRCGLDADPDYAYFFASLTDYLNGCHKYPQALLLTDTMLAVRPHNPFFWYAKSLVLLNQKKYKESIMAADSAIKYDSIYMHAYYNKGLSLCNLAVSMSDSAAAHISQDDYQTLRQKSVSYYAQALRPMEIVRVLAPRDTMRWAPPLYRIYLNLNMESQFSQIESILKQFGEK